MKTIALAIFVLALPAAAQPADTTVRPWAEGVSAANQNKALALFREGNSALKESLFKKAAVLYREALQSWDHPAIHYNLALALLSLDQPLETYDHLLASLKYGPSPMDAEKYDQALRYKGAVEQQLAVVTIVADTPGAAVKLDGVQVIVGPGKYESRVRAGAHTVVASKEGFLTWERSDTLVGGTNKSYAVTLKTAEDLTEYRRRWPAAVPWIPVVAGAVLAGSGIGLHLSAGDAFKAYDRGIQGCVRVETGGCTPSVALAGTRSSGDTMQTVAMVSYAVGTAALVTGAVLVYLNRLQPYRATVDVAPTVSVVPLLGPANGAALFVTF